MKAISEKYNPVEVKLASLVFTAMGEISVCWDPRPSGVFESDKATSVANKLTEDIIDLIRKQ